MTQLNDKQELRMKILNEYYSGNMRIKNIAEHFRVSNQFVRNIINGYYVPPTENRIFLEVGGWIHIR